MAYKFMWGQKQSAMVAEAMILNFAVDNDVFTITSGIDDVMREHNDGYSNIYFSEDSMQRGFDNGKVFLTNTGTKKILTTVKKVQINFQKFVQRIRKIDYESLPERDILQLLLTYQKHLIFLQKMFRATDPSGTKLVEDKIMGILAPAHDEAERISYFTVLTTPVAIDKTQLELMDWYTLCRKKEKVKNADLLEHVLKYPGNFANTLSYGDMISYLKERREETDLKSLKEQVSNIKKAKKVLGNKQNAIFKRYKTTLLKQHCYTLQKLAITRFEIKHNWSGAETLCLDFLRNIASRINIEFQRFFYSYNFTDIIRYFETKKRLSDKEIQERLAYSIVHYHNGNLLYLYGEEAKKYFDKKHSIEYTAESLKGLIANKGYAIGQVKIVKVNDLEHLKKDTINFLKGEILVTTMTSPAMVTLASKASAIVTNEGGICSHAAIIARELQIPCIVGTHYATNILKNGDTIEVDANKGIVRKV